VIKSSSHLKWMAIVATLGITVTAGVRPSTAARQPAVPATTATAADLANEERALAKYFDDLVAFDSECAKLAKQPVLEHIHINPFQVKSDDLKSRLPGVQNTIREIIRKLKAANEWDDLDASLAAKITDGTSNTFFKETTFRQLLEESSNGLTSHGNEISIPLDKLRKKIITGPGPGDGADLQIVRAAYETPAPMKFVSVRCSIGRARIGLGIKLGHYPTGDTINRVAGACGENGTYNPF